MEIIQLALDGDAAGRPDGGVDGTQFFTQENKRTLEGEALGNEPQVRVLGTGLWDDSGTTREPALVGGWFAAPTPEAAGDFQRRFEAAYGHRPPRIASLAYDAAALAAVLAGIEQGPRFDHATLTSASGFAGNDGIFRFRQDGIAERGLAVLEVTKDGFRVLSEAPATFEAPAFQLRPDS